MATKKEGEDKLTVKAFKEDKASVWCAGKHWRVIGAELILCAGGLLDESEYSHVFKYFKTKKLL